MRFRLHRGLATLFLAPLIAGCGTVPRPFAHTELAPPGRLVGLPGGSGIQVRPLAGVPEKLATALAEAFALHLRKANIPATTASTFSAGHVLSGRLEPLEDAPAEAPLAHLVWTLRQADGKLIGSFDQLVRGDAKGWAEVDPKLIDLIAGDMGSRIVGLLQDQPRQPAPPPAQVFFLKPIAWPRGAGEVSVDRGIVLRNALGHALRRAGGLIAAEEKQAMAVIEGSVTIGPERDGARLVSILWRVRHPRGSPGGGGEIGKIRQANRVGVTRLNKEWGDLAVAAAGGAAAGITDLLDRAPAGGK